MTIFFSGNTETVTVTYMKRNMLVDPDAPPVVTLYAIDQMTVIGTPGSATMASTGIWEYNQTLPSTTGEVQYIIEFLALFGGQQVRIADIIDTAFVINTA